MANSLRPASDLRELLVDPGNVVLYAWKNILIYVGKGRADVELIRSLEPALDLHLREVGLASLVCLMTAAPALPDETRKRAYKELLTSLGGRIPYIAVVVDDEGFVGSAVRAIITGLLIVTGRQQSLHIASSAKKAAGWLATKHAAATGGSIDPHELTAVIENARARASSPAAHRAT